MTREIWTPGWLINRWADVMIREVVFGVMQYLSSVLVRLICAGDILVDYVEGTVGMLSKQTMIEKE